MAAGDITFIVCPYGDSFPVRKTASLSGGSQQVVCPRCGHGFEVVLPESVERLSQCVPPPVPPEATQHTTR